MVSPNLLSHLLERNLIRVVYKSALLSADFVGLVLVVSGFTFS